MRIRISALCSFSIAIALTAAAPAQAALTYVHDNGTVGGSAGYIAGNDLVVGNWFATQPGFHSITGISVFWNALPGASVELGIVDDPNGDGNLADGVVLQSLTVNPGAGDVGQFVTYALGGTASVGAGFFVAAYIDNGPGGNSAIPFDTSSGNNGLGFSRAIQNQGSTLLSLSQGAVTFPDAFWMIRATAVSEPTALMLLGLGLLGVGFSRRRRT